MGRKKLELKFISSRKKRQEMFAMRRKNMEKKAHELSTLCDVKICIILYRHIDDDVEQNEPIIWPENRPQLVQNLISSYKNQPNNHDVRSSRSYNLLTFLDERAKAVEEQVGRFCSENQQKENRSCYENLSYEELVQFGNHVGATLETVKARIDLLKGVIGQSDLPDNSYPNPFNYLLMEPEAKKETAPPQYMLPADAFQQRVMTPFTNQLAPDFAPRYPFSVADNNLANFSGMTTVASDYNGAEAAACSHDLMFHGDTDNVLSCDSSSILVENPVVDDVVVDLTPCYFLSTMHSTPYFVPRPL